MQSDELREKRRCRQAHQLHGWRLKLGRLDVATLGHLWRDRDVPTVVLRGLPGLRVASATFMRRFEIEVPIRAKAQEEARGGHHRKGNLACQSEKQGGLSAGTHS